MLTALEAYSSWESAPVLPLSDFGPETDLIQIRNVEGLGPVKATVNASAYGSMDGASFTGSQVFTRNIVITVGLNPDWANWSMEELRRLLYAYFMPKLPVRLIFKSNDEFPAVEITGIVEDVAPTIFSKDVELQISIICPDPYFTAVDPTVVAGVTNTPAEIDYNGSIEVGINVKVQEQILPAPSNIGIQVGDPTSTFFRVAAPVTAAKYFSMNSVPGQKYVQNVEIGTGVITNLLSKVEEGSSWPTLKPGLNDFSVITNAGVQDWELTYYEKFGGL